MNALIQQMTVDEYAEARRALGERVEKLGAIYWVCTRRFFFRPILPYEAYSVSKGNVPTGHVGGFQYVVSEPNDSNSVMGFLMLDGVQDYALDKLEHNRRRLIKRAGNQFVIQPIVDITEFKEAGFRAYCSFYERTHYGYKPERTKRENYAKWVDSVLQSPKTLKLGGFDLKGELRAVSLSYWVGATLTYTTFFSDTPALKQGVGELMFHALRDAASRSPGIHDVFVRNYQGGNNMDYYYLLRGAKLVIKPSRLQLDPVSRCILRFCFPAKYNLLSEKKGPEEPPKACVSAQPCIPHTQVK
jgi:hypothetical protein